MRFFVLFLFVLSVFTFSEAAHAYTYDDSVVIEIGDVPPPQPTNDPSTSGAASDTGGSDTTNSSAESSGSGSSATSDGSGTSDAGSSGTSGNGPTVSGGTSSGGGTSVTATLFDVLTASGAITEESGGSGTDQGQSIPQSSGNPDTGTNSVQSDGTGASDGGSSSGNTSGGGGGTSGGGGGTITIDGAKVRETLLGKLSFKDILDDHAARVRGGLFGNALSNRDIGLMAASTIIGDSNIDEISFGATRLEIVYHSQGYVLGFIPKSFAARISVDPQAVALGSRVNIALPWYRFLLRKLFNTTSLTQEIDAIVKSEGSPREGENAADIKVRLFTDISQLLKKKIGTIGIPAQAGQ
ncbi:hypothetical protein HY418_00210 [Candidatus Kaiserbacteria bacterium]|nr:hypothetical protein [Candidatus Kaiserbacteria bacterium]